MIPLTKNEKKVLGILLSNGRESDAEIARQLTISLQGARKIRKGLEEKGIIEGYVTKVNYKKLGITNFAIALIRVTAEAWEKYGSKGINDKLHIENAVKSYRIMSGNISHMIIYAFTDTSSLHTFFKKMQEKESKSIEIEKLYTFSNEGIGRVSMKDLIRHILDKGIPK